MSLHTTQCPARSTLSLSFSSLLPEAHPQHHPFLHSNYSPPPSALPVLVSSPCDKEATLACSCFSSQSVFPVVMPRYHPSRSFGPPSLRPEGLLFRSMNSPSCSVPRGLCTCPSCAWSIDLLLTGPSGWRREPQADGWTEVSSPRSMGRASGSEAGAGGAARAHSLRPWKPFLSHFILVANTHDPYPKEIWGQSWMPATKLVLSLKGP